MDQQIRRKDLAEGWRSLWPQEKFSPDSSWANPPKIVGTWKPELTEQQKEAHAAYVIDHKCPF